MVETTLDINCLKDHEVLPSCRVMFTHIDKELTLIRLSIVKLMWWLISFLTVLVTGLVIYVFTTRGV